jgi:signal transduction histidine kinase
MRELGNCLPPGFGRPQCAASTEAPARHSWRRAGALWDYFQSFFADPARTLNCDERLALERELLEALLERTAWWLITVLIASLAVFLCGKLIGGQSLTFLFLKASASIWIWLWLAVIWAISGCYFSVKSRLQTVMRLPPLNREEREGKREKLHRLELIWAGWLAAIMVVWIVFGAWPLTPEQSTILGKPSFLLLTILGQISTVLFLCVSWRVLFSVLAAVVICVSLVVQDLHIPKAHLYVYYYGAMALTLFIAWVKTLEQRRVRTKGILLEVERTRAEAERRRANTFIAAISHDLRQPLTMISLKLSSLLRQIDTPKIQDELRQIKEQAIAIETMVNGSLHLSKLQAGELKVEIRDIALPQLVEKIAESLRPEADAKNVRLEVNSAPYLVRTDANLLNRILRNLLENAIRYTPALTKENRPGKVLLECRPVGDVMRISIIDNGIGIPREKFPEIFEEYVQLSNPERDRSKGIGIGLSTVRSSVELLRKHERKHDLEYDSEEGQGSRFSVLVPIIASIPPELLPRSDRDHDPDLTGLTVALVDDDEGPRGALRQRLLQCGCYVVDAESAENLIDKIKLEGVPSGPHFILSDYQLRESKNGIDAITVVRQATGLQIPAALWAAATTSRILERAAAAGLPTVLKPDETQVLRLLRQRAEEIRMT